MNKISVSIAMPTTGEDIEHLNRELFEKNIIAELRRLFPDCHKILVNVFEHDGTGEDEIYYPKTDDDEYDYVSSVIQDAVGKAFVDESSYQSSSSAAAAKLRAIPSEKRSEQSRLNGKRGGRPAKTQPTPRGADGEESDAK